MYWHSQKTIQQQTQISISTPVPGIASSQQKKENTDGNRQMLNVVELVSGHERGWGNKKQNAVQKTVIFVCLSVMSWHSVRILSQRPILRSFAFWPNDQNKSAVLLWIGEELSGGLRHWTMADVVSQRAWHLWTQFDTDHTHVKLKKPEVTYDLFWALVRK